MRRRQTTAALTLAAAAALSACAVGPTYQRPTAPGSEAFKETPGWVRAAPADALDRGPWWALFDDAVLSGLLERVNVSNQNVAAAAAAYEQARALVREQRAALFPSVTLNSSAGRSGGGNAGAANRLDVSIGASWEPDVWGRLRRATTGATASAEASAADLASARLSAQGELALDYFTVRQTDAEMALLDATITGYQRALQITQNRYDAGVVPRTDVLQAQTQLASAQADRVGLERQRAQFEHAIAVLVGEAPANFTLPAAAWVATVPAVPSGLPSTLLQRRPDIAAAERRVAVANENIGIAQAAYYPSLPLDASYGYGASRVGELFSASSSLWSLGIRLAQTVFDAGATRARVSGAQAAQDEAVARYRQTVLTAFQDVEDQLAATRVLEQQYGLRQQASQAADLAEAQVVNRYRAGQVGFSDVVTAQNTALGARRTLVQVTADRQTTAVALIQALGGGWRAEPAGAEPPTP